MSGRMDAIAAETKAKDAGGFPERFWYVDDGKLDALNIAQWRATPDATNYVRVIPPKDPNAYFGLKYFAHFNVGPNRDAFLCRRAMKRQYGDKVPHSADCPICAWIEKLRSQGVADADLKAYNAWPPRYLFFMIDVTNEETIKKGIQLYDAPQTINNEILTLSKNRRTGELIDISDPKHGKTLIFDRKGKKQNDTRYEGFQLEDDPEELSEDWLDVPDLHEILFYATDEQMKQVVQGMAAGGVAPKPEEAKAPPAASSAPTPPPAAEPAPAPSAPPAAPPAAAAPDTAGIRARVRARLQKPA